MTLLASALVLAPFYLRDILWMTPIPPVVFRIYTMERKMIKVKKGATDFEIFENHGVIPTRVEKQYGGFRKFLKDFENPQELVTRDRELSRTTKTTAIAV